MDVSAVSLDVSATSPWAARTTGRPQRPFRAAMDAAATALGMSPSDLMQAVRGGQSLADVAKSKGMSQDDLVAAIATAIGKQNTNLSADQATQIATRIATAAPGQGGSPGTAGVGIGGHHRHGHAGGDGDLLGAVAQVLDEPTDQVASALRSGQSLADLAKSKGVSVDDVVKALAGAFQEQNPNLSADQAAQLATEFTNAGSASGPRLSVTA